MRRCDPPAGDDASTPWWRTALEATGALVSRTRIKPRRLSRPGRGPKSTVRPTNFALRRAMLGAEPTNQPHVAHDRTLGHPCLHQHTKSVLMEKPPHLSNIERARHVLPSPRV